MPNFTYYQSGKSNKTEQTKASSNLTNYQGQPTKSRSHTN